MGGYAKIYTIHEVSCVLWENDRNAWIPRKIFQKILALRLGLKKKRQIIRLPLTYAGIRCLVLADIESMKMLKSVHGGSHRGCKLRHQG